MAPMAAEAASCSGRRRFAVACSVLSRCVRAEATGNTAAARARSSSPTMLLMPGADVVREEEKGETAAAEAPAPPAHQLTIMYGGRVLVFDDVPADTAAKLMCVAVAARRDTPPHGLPADLQVARKASLQRLMEKRRDRIAARVPYAAAARPAAAVVVPNKGQEEEGHAASWLGLGLGLGVPGGRGHRE